MDTLLKETVNAAVNSRYPTMNPEGRKLIEEILVRKDFEKGEILLSEGQVSHDIMIVGKGMVRQFYYKNGKDVTEHFSYEGCIVMCIESLLKQEPTRLMIEALEDGTGYLLNHKKLNLLAETSWEVNMFYRKILEFSLITSQIKADSSSFQMELWRLQNLAPARLTNTPNSFYSFSYKQLRSPATCRQTLLRTLSRTKIQQSST